MNDSDFRQFTGAFDSAVEPDTAFVEQLQQRIASASLCQTMQLQSPIPAPLPARRVRQPAPPRRSNPFYIAAAALIVFALAVASIVQLTPRVLEEQYSSQVVATLPSGVSSTPGADVMLDAELLPGVGSVGPYYIIENTLVGVMHGSNPDVAQLVSYDLETREIRWQQDVSDWMHFVFNDQVAVGTSYEYLGDMKANAFPEFDEMVAFDIRTGEKLWTNSIADWRMVHGWETFRMAGDQVIFLQGEELLAIDASTGETRWQAPYQLRTASDGNVIDMPALTNIDDSLYVVQLDGSVEVFNLATGEPTREYALPATFKDAHPVSVQLFPVPAGLLVVADSYVGSGLVTTLLVVNPDSGDVVWERSLDQSGRVVVSPDGSIAIAAYTWESAPLLLRLIGQDGHSYSALIWLNAKGEMILATERVRMPDVAPLLVAVNPKYVCVTMRELTCFDRAGTRYTVDIPVAWDAVLVGDVLLVVTDRGVMRVDLP